MARFLTLFTLVPSLFAFIAVILINIGGISDILHPSSTRSNLIAENRTQFPLLSWRFALSASLNPDTITARHTSHLYLNRFCTGPVPGSIYCHATRSFDRRTLWAPANGFLASLRPFIFQDVDLTVAFAFYVIAGVAAFLGVVLGVLSGFVRGRVVRVAGVVVSVVGFLTLLIASALLTWQATRMKQQTEDSTIRSAMGPSMMSGMGPTTIYRINMLEVTLGKTVMGLTWTAVVLMLGGVVLWGVGLADARKEEKNRRSFSRGEKGEDVVDGGRGGCSAFCTHVFDGC